MVRTISTKINQSGDHRWMGGQRDRAVVAIRVKPGASCTGVGGRYEGVYGAALVVAVTEPAVDGRATEAAVRAVARALRLRPADVSVKVGATSRDKLLEIAEPPADLPDRVAVLRNPHNS
jgi:uncharacterized protein YggU (UPF0235/DUF167 family)